jgi:DoxX-like family
MAVSNATPGGESSESRSMTRALWILQGLLALLFLFAGGMKLVMPIEDMTKDVALPGLFLRFIGVAEVLGGIGMILPGLVGIRPGLTPLAATGLVIIMIGATVLTLATGGVGPALFPLVVGLLLAFVAYGRWRHAPHGGSSQATVLHSAR